MQPLAFGVLPAGMRSKGRQGSLFRNQFPNRGVKTKPFSPVGKVAFSRIIYGKEPLLDIDHCRHQPFLDIPRRGPFLDIDHFSDTKHLLPYTKVYPQLSGVAQLQWKQSSAEIITRTAARLNHSSRTHCSSMIT